MLEWIQGACVVGYGLMLGSLLCAGFFCGAEKGQEKRIWLAQAQSAEWEIRQARKKLRSGERLVLCLPYEQIANWELYYIAVHMQQKDPASGILWIEEKGARAG